ncbi:excinuclease ABC subunit UvrC [Defluviitalea phaphyphila]|uniref:excinuclease ABC subunit UvrC n=1 Tax=Defluviitalea phaphyphila TaxID=1473580 RepID=UPI000730F6B6|nr:excinuclease ABC subunit UvrC [Defluviitalea phaphyphila]
MFDIQEELKKLPQKPGVYLMKDQYDNIIYVGKAVNLRNRVRQYFQNSRNHSPKVKRMVLQIKEFEYIVTDSEVEALILECNLIKKYRPKYNIRLKDDKNYPYIKITINESYPKVFMTRKLLKDKAKYFGPYTDATALKETLELIVKLWPIRTCNRVLPRDIGKERPCLQYHIGQCKAPCAGFISEEEYKKMIEEIISFLDGKYEKVIKELEKQMKEASENLNFEKAAKIKNQIDSIKRIAQKQKMINSAMEDQDVIAFAKTDNEALVQVYFVRGGKVIGREHFLLDGVDERSQKEIMTSFVKQFYAGTTFIPREVILQEEIDEINIIQSWLSSRKGKKVYIKVPRKGDKSKLVNMAAQNALLTLNQFGEEMKRKEKRTKGALEEIQNALGLDKNINRIEAYDISNTQGIESVGSMVVFEEGKPKRSDYRKFKIKSVIGPNDYASMEEVIRRRFTHAKEELKELEKKGLSLEEGKFSKLPDLILIDGGKGQVKVVIQVLDELNISIPVCGMVKDDKHRTRGLLYKGEEVRLPKGTEGFKLITRIQDEAHRFAIEYHRRLRSKKQIQSVLDEIPGVGAVRKKALLLHFKSVQRIKEASIEDIKKVKGIPSNIAENIYNFFHK